MERTDWWKECIVCVPRPIPTGMMVGMRDEVRDGRRYLVEFLELVPEYKPNPFTRAAKVMRKVKVTDDDDDDVVTLAWSRERGFAVLNGKRVVQEALW